MARHTDTGGRASQSTTGGLASALPSYVATSAATWRALFPPATAYPRGAQLSPMHTDKRADALVDPDTAARVARDVCVVGSIQYAPLSRRGVASVTVLAFRTSGGAAAFPRQDHPTALADPTQPGAPVGGLGRRGTVRGRGVFLLRGGRAAPGHPHPAPRDGRGPDPDTTDRSGPDPVPGSCGPETVRPVDSVRPHTKTRGQRRAHPRATWR